MGDAPALQRGQGGLHNTDGVLVDGGQAQRARRGVPGLGVVKARQTDVLGDPQVGGPQDVQDPQGQGVVGADHGGGPAQAPRRRPQGQEHVGPRPHAVGLVIAPDTDLGDLQAQGGGLLGGGPRPHIPAAPSDHPRHHQVTVALARQVADDLTHGGGVVGVDREDPPLQGRGRVGPYHRAGHLGQQGHRLGVRGGGGDEQDAAHALAGQGVYRP